MTKLIIEVSLPRCGTTSLMRLMRGFENVTTYGEVFHNTPFWVSGPEAESVWRWGSVHGGASQHDPHEPFVWALEADLGTCCKVRKGIRRVPQALSPITSIFGK